MKTLALLVAAGFVLVACNAPAPQASAPPDAGIRRGDICGLSAA